MDETYSEMIEKEDIRIPSSWELSMAEYEDGVPIYRKRFSKAEYRKNSYVEWLNGVIKSDSRMEVREKHFPMTQKRS